jgi:hypothetical protein
MGRFITETGTASSVVREVNSAYNAVVNDRILADTSSAAFTVTLPLNSSLLVNDTIQFIDIGGSFATNNLTLGRNGSNMQGLAEDLVLDLNGATITLMYSGPTYGWIIIGT